MSEDKLGINLFETYSKFQRASYEIDEFLDNVIKVDDSLYHDWTFDEYDNSIEFKEADPALRLTNKQQVLLGLEGFDRCWICHKDGWETYYGDLKNPRGGTRKFTKTSASYVRPVCDSGKNAQLFCSYNKSEDCDFCGKPEERK